MNNNPIAELSKSDEIPCLLLPLIDVTLLVPTVTVAEMAPMNPFEPVEGMPDWMLGFYQWREQHIPVLSYEMLNGAGSPSINTKGRVAVLNNTGTSDKIHFIAILTQGIPRMSRVGSNDIQQDEDADKKAFDLMPVRVGLEQFTIPDIIALENAYIEASEHR